MTFVSHDTMKMFDRAAQRERARQFEQAQLAAGAVRPAPMAIPITAKPAKMPWSPSSLGSTVVPKAKKAAKTSWLQETFVNEFGQSIAPGQKVVATKSGYNHSIKVSLATYLGLHRAPNGKISSVIIEDHKTQKKTALVSKRIYPTL